MLAQGVELLGEYEGSGYKEPRYLARRSDGQLIQLTDLLYLIAERVDGRKSYEELARDTSAAYRRGVSADNVRQLVEKSLVRDGVVTLPGRPQPELKKVDPLLRLKLRITLVPEAAVNFLAALLRPLFWPPVMVAVLVGLVAVDVWYFGTHGIGQSLRGAIYEPLVMLLLYGLLVLSIGWHELGHATACRYGGARPGKIGFGIYIIWPAFYTDVTDVYRLGRAGRVRTDLSGMYFNAIFALATAAVYFVTGFEPVLVLIMLQHALILYNFMPFLRLDGYFVISDLTGVPDLFSRIKPTLASLLPWKETPKQVSELKRGVRMVVGLWVMTVVPVLLFLLTMMVLAAPRVLATAWDSLLLQWGKLSAALDGGEMAAAATSGVRAGLVIAPVTGMVITFGRMVKRALVGFWDLFRRRPAVGFVAGIAGAAVAGVAVFVLLPNGEYKPIQQGERWTFGEAISAVEEIESGRPSLTEEREEQLGGAPMLHQSEEASVDSDTTEGTTETEPREPGGSDNSEEDADGTDEEEAQEEATPTPTATATPTPTASSTIAE